MELVKTYKYIGFQIFVFFSNTQTLSNMVLRTIVRSTQLIESYKVSLVKTYQNIALQIFFSHSKQTLSNMVSRTIVRGTQQTGSHKIDSVKTCQKYQISDYFCFVLHKTQTQSFRFLRSIIESS